MKLIIDIPEENYKLICSDGRPFLPSYTWIKNGTPLEQIRDEIQNCMQYQFDMYGTQRYFKIEDIWQIIDKYIGG